MARLRAAGVTAVAARLVVPVLILWAVILGLGLAVTGPLAPVVQGEDTLSREVAADRTGLGNSITFVWSHIGNIEIIIPTCLVVSLIIWWRTRRLIVAAVAPLALSAEALVFSTVSVLVGRSRPPVPELDLAPPTASYPSGHVGATTAVYVSFALLATRIERTWLRRLTVTVCLIVPLLVAFARLYRGMHHVTDIAAGFLNGLVCALLAFGWYRFRTRAGSPETVRATAGEPGAEPVVAGD